MCLILFITKYYNFFATNSLFDKMLVLYNNVTYKTTKQSKHQPVVTLQIKQPV